MVVNAQQFSHPSLSLTIIIIAGKEFWSQQHKQQNRRTSRHPRSRPLPYHLRRSPPPVTTANSSYYTDITLGDSSNDLILPTTQRHLTSEEEIQNLTCDSIPNLQFCRDQRRSRVPFSVWGLFKFLEKKNKKIIPHTHKPSWITDETPALGLS